MRACLGTNKGMYEQKAVLDHDLARNKLVGVT